MSSTAFDSTVQGLAAAERCSVAAQPRFGFWDLFYPWVLWYLIFYYLKGAGSWPPGAWRVARSLHSLVNICDHAIGPCLSRLTTIPTHAIACRSALQGCGLMRDLIAIHLQSSRTHHQCPFPENIVAG